MKGYEARNLLYGWRVWELRREGEGELRGPTPAHLFPGTPLVIQPRLGIDIRKKYCSVLCARQVIEDSGKARENLCKYERKSSLNKPPTAASFFSMNPQPNCLPIWHLQRQCGDARTIQILNNNQVIWMCKAKSKKCIVRQWHAYA